MAPRPLTQPEIDIIRAGARDGLACTVIVDQLHEAGFTRSPRTVSTSHPFRAGRVERDQAAKRSIVLSREANARVAAAKVSAAENVNPTRAVDDIVFEAAKNGASLREIVNALHDAGRGNYCTSTIGRLPAYKEGRAQSAKVKHAVRSWSERERELVRDGARRGLGGVELSRVLAEAGFDRGSNNITASNHFSVGRRLAKEDAALAAEAEAATSAEPHEPVSASEDPDPDAAPKVVRRFNGVSLPFLSIQKDWGEVVTR